MAPVAGPPRYGYIDALRGFAIAGVVIYHLRLVAPNPHWPVAQLADFGVEGVQLFFVVSAMTLMMSWNARHDGAIPFWLRRLFRIAPMFWVAIVIHEGLNASGILHWHTTNPTDILMAVLFLHGWSFTAMNHVVPGGWTVGAEMMFYAMFPWLALLVTTLRRAILFAVAAWLITIAANSAFAAAATSWPTNDLNGYLTWWPPNALPGFAMGFVVYYLLPFAPRSWQAAFALRAAALGLAVICPPPWYFSWDHPLARPILVLPACALIILSLANRPAPFLVNGVTRFVGRVSYSAYLLQFLAVDAVAVCYPWLRQSAIPAVVVFVFAFLAALTATVAAAAVTYRWIEQPGIRAGHRFIRRLARNAQMD